MDELTRTFNGLGLSWLVDQLPERVRGARLRLGTNDVVLAVFPKADNHFEAQVFTKTREQALKESLATDPPLIVTAERLAQKLSPVDVHVLIYTKDKTGPLVFAAILSMPSTTEGVLN